MDTQLIVVALIVAGALSFVGRRAWRSMAATRKSKSGCGSGGGCH